MAETETSETQTAEPLVSKSATAQSNKTETDKNSKPDPETHSTLRDNTQHANQDNANNDNEIIDSNDPAHHQNHQQRNKIQVSREKKPLNFFITLAKKFLSTEDEIELSGLGLAVTTAVTVAEILRSQGIAEVARIETSLADERKEDNTNVNVGGRGNLPKAKIQIWIRRAPNFQEVISKDEHGKRLNTRSPFVHSNETNESTT